MQRGFQKDCKCIKLFVINVVCRRRVLHNLLPECFRKPELLKFHEIFSQAMPILVRLFAHRQAHTSPATTNMDMTTYRSCTGHIGGDSLHILSSIC